MNFTETSTLGSRFAIVYGPDGEAMAFRSTSLRGQTTHREGFSGGPVFISTGSNLQVAAIVSGYWMEPTEVIKGKPVPAADPKDVVNVNSGFILAYDINIAADLIKKNPIGPLRPTK